jgi:hypothetical protein
MWPFRRRSPRGGKHLRRAAVVRSPGVAPLPTVATIFSPVTPAVALLTSAPVPAHTPHIPAVPAGPRIQLGFRDGTTASLALDSEQARALMDLACLLNQRNDV